MGSNCEKSKFQNDNRVLVESFTGLNYLPANTGNESNFQMKGFDSVLFFTYVGGNGQHIIFLQINGSRNGFNGGSDRRKV